MDLSGIIFVLLAVAWAVFLIPKALRHHDELARTRAIDRFSASTRVLARREPVNDRDARLVLTPPRPAATRVAATAPRQGSTSVTPAPAAAPRRAGAPLTRAATRAAARRRRRILAFLLLCLLVTAAAAALGYAPRWAVAVPGGLTVLYLLLCRTQVRRETAVAVPAPVDRVVQAGPPEPVEVEPTPAPVTVPAQRTGTESVDEQRVAVFDDEDTMGVSVAALREAGLTGTDSGRLWDPLPVTLPTYVTAPRAHRTVRTIDLGEPGTWTSGRTEEDAQVATQATQPAAAEDAGRRATGS